jgi:hypoxanthine phosphoribosyltransferase
VSGGYEQELSTPELVKQVIRDFKVDEKTASGIIAFCNTFAFEKMNKWIRNMKKRQKEKADYIYSLIRRLKRRDESVIDEIEKKILELCVET